MRDMLGAELPPWGSWWTGKEWQVEMVLRTIQLIATDERRVERCKCGTRSLRKVIIKVLNFWIFFQTNEGFFKNKIIYFDIN